MLKLLALVAATAIVAAQAPAPFELPAPTGKLPVGTTQWVVADPSRQETFATGKQREVQVIAWYPSTVRSGDTALYMRNGIEEALSFARLAKLGDAYNGLASVKTHSILDAAPASSPARFPVIVFSHGYTGLPSSHTALAEDLASHGWAVLHVIHPYEAAATLSDGTFVTFTNEKDAMRPGVLEVLKEWGPEGSTIDKVVAATDNAEKETLLRGYLASLKNTDQVVKRWVLDVKLVLDRLPTRGAGSALAAKLDLSRLGVAGHSMGGVMAGQFCVEDRRCKAGLNLDGIPQYGTMIDTPMPAPFMMAYSGRPGRAGASDLIYSRSASKYYRADVADALHIDFTEMNFWGGPLRQRGAFGKIAPERATELTRLLVREFFGQEILGRKSLLIGDSQPIAGVTVRELRKP
ncbi:MAG: alpha/beta hydrolase family protein [Vicinamibacterales bacterium]